MKTSNASNVVASLFVRPASESSTFSQYTLAETPARAFTFLYGFSRSTEVNAALRQGGFTVADHDKGWALLKSAAGQNATSQVAPPDLVARVGDAVASLEAFTNGAFRRLRAALERMHPEQGAFLFDGLEQSHGPEAVATITIFLQRVELLEKSPKRKETRKADRAALVTLTRRGLTEEARAKLDAYLAAAQSSPEPVVKTPEEKAAEQAAFVALRVWYNDWAETARTLALPRRVLIKLGLAKRKSPRKGAEPAPVVVSPALPPGTGTPVT